MTIPRFYFLQKNSDRSASLNYKTAQAPEQIKVAKSLNNQIYTGGFVKVYQFNFIFVI